MYDPVYNALVKNSIKVPPLVERKGDIDYFARTAFGQLNRVFTTEKSLSEEVPGISLKALYNCLSSYDNEGVKEAEPASHLRD